MRTIGLSANGRVVGEHHPRAKLTFAKVEEMRHLRNEHGLTFKALGEHFGVSGRTAWQIVRGKTWAVEVVATKQQATEQDKARVLELRAQRLGPASIARAMGVTRHSVSRLTTGIPRPPKTHCKHGHPLSGDNLLIRHDGYRECKQCRSAGSRAAYERRKAARLAGEGTLRTVAINDAGLRIGEDHQNAKYTNGEIEMVLSLRDEGKSYGEIGRLVEMPKSTVRDIIKGRRRCQYPADFKTIKE
ncbi:MAG: hypothetical protein Q8N89_16930 [Azonexus sp.]|nr:hypothetical protein [Azonexus sp.]